MDYKQRYEDALERAKECHIDGLALHQPVKVVIEHIFPELKESEDEKIKKAISDILLIDSDEIREIFDANNVLMQDIDNWLEKQGEQQSTNDAKPKFKVGDWIVQEGVGTYKIIEVCGWYEVIGIDGNQYSISFLWENDCRLWTIQDAKDGDVLATDSDSICIFDGTVEDDKYPFAYCGLIGHYVFEVYDRKLPFTHNNDVHPATKEQRDLLFSKMKEAGYEWNSEKKELKKIEQKPAFCHHEVDLSGCSEEYRKAYYDGWNNCNQQHSQLKAEQKPAWSEEDEEIIKCLNNCLDELEEKNGWHYVYVNYKNVELNKIRNWLKSLKKKNERRIEL